MVALFENLSMSVLVCLLQIPGPVRLSWTCSKSLRSFLETGLFQREQTLLLALRQGFLSLFFGVAQGFVIRSQCVYGIFCKHRERMDHLLARLRILW